MAAGATDIVIRFLADISDMTDGVKKVDTKLGKLADWGKKIAFAFGGAFAVDQIGQMIGAAEEANAVSAGLAQSLKNAGDATGEWDKHAEDLANTLQYKTGIDDEVIKRAQTILGTFHTLAGATGQQTGAFDRATKAALDLSKAGFGDASSTATMLGKALEDPTRGLTALRRVGVNFTADQEKLIKSLVESGDKAGAMNVILGNVESQVGGMAEKTATSSDKMKVAWGETQEAIGNALIPVMNQLLPILTQVAMFVQRNAGWLVPLTAAVIGVTAAVWAFNLALSANPIVLVTLAIAALVAGIILLWQNWDTVWTAVLGLLQTVWDWISTNWPLLLAILTGPFGLAALWITNNWQAILNFFGSIPGWIAGFFSTLGQILLWPYKWAWDQVYAIWTGVIGLFSNVVTWISNALAGLGNIIVSPFSWAWDQIVRIKDDIVGAFQGAVDSVKNIWNAFARFWNNIEVEVPGVTMPGPIPNIPGFTFGLPDLPTFAKGGIVTRPTLALIGERGPEAVVPLGSSDWGMGGTTIIVNVTTTGLGADSPQIQRDVVAALRGYTTVNGLLTGIAG